MEQKILTDAGIRAAFSTARKSNKTIWVSDGYVPKSHGGLQLRAEPHGGGRWYWRYTSPESKKIRISLGVLSLTKVAGSLTLNEARSEVALKASLYQKDESRDVREHLKRELERVETKRKADALTEAAKVQAKIAAEKHTLSGLMDAYVEHLEKQGKQAAYDAKNLFKNHVKNTHTAIAAKPANTVTAHDIVALLRPLTESEKGRTAAKLRSYLRAAYSLAAGAALNPDAPAALVAFNIEASPVAATNALSKYNQARERALTSAELRAFWTHLKSEPESATTDALMLTLLLGGQRPAQLLRATTHDVDTVAKTIKLFDGKGKRSNPRVHQLPLTDAAIAVIERCKARALKQESDLLFSSHGRVLLRPENLSAVTRQIAASLLKSKLAASSFQLRDLRRTCETLMAGMGVSRDIRAQIQSHGLGGVQARHYDKHDYAHEKATTLEAWAKHLVAKPSINVLELVIEQVA